jgi:hypothetical protein
MKPWLRHGSSKAISAVVALFAVGGLGAAVTAGTLAVGTGCSSSSSGSSSGASSSGGTTADGGSSSGTGPDVVGTGMMCPANAHETVGAKISLTVTWPSTLANAGCDNSSKPPCTGIINIWLLTHYDITGTAVTGTVSTCKNVTPPIPLSAVGTQSEGLDPKGPPAVVQIGFDDAVWQAIIANSMVKPTQTTGTLAGWNVGSSMRINPTNSVYGLSSTSKWASDKTTWSGSEMDIAAADITDDDNDGHPGITATPSTAAGNSLPATAALATPPGPFADKLYLALRTELSLYGKSTTCTDMDGTVGVQLLNNHVIGCELADGGGNCNMSQWDFIDSNTTVYLGPGVKIPVAQQSMPASFAPPGISGTFKAKILSTDAAGGGITCADVVSMLQ